MRTNAEDDFPQILMILSTANLYRMFAKRAQSHTLIRHFHFCLLRERFSEAPSLGVEGATENLQLKRRVIIPERFLMRLSLRRRAVLVIAGGTLASDKLKGIDNDLGCFTLNAVLLPLAISKRTLDID